MQPFHIVATLLFVSRTPANFGDRAFSAAGPRVWDKLPTYHTAVSDCR